MEILYIEGFNGDLVTYTNLVMGQLYNFPKGITRTSKIDMVELKNYDRIVYLGHGEKTRWIVRNHQNVNVKDLPKHAEIVSIACGTDLSGFESIYFSETLIGVHLLSNLYPAIRILLRKALDSTLNIGRIYEETKVEVRRLYEEHPFDAGLLRFLRVMKRGQYNNV